MDHFEFASRNALRFSTPQGVLTVEDLWNLPLQTTKANRASLDDIGMCLVTRIKEASGTTSLVDEKASGPAPADEVGLAIVKHIIGVKKAENAAAADKVKRAADKQRILELIGEKQDDELKGKTLDELKALAAAL
jgi:hypothetical protein